MGLEVEAPEAGCCGMAGAFGFERGEHYEVSMAAGERALLPAVRAAADATYVVAGGFSCREQIRQGAGRDAMHPAQLMALALSQPGQRRPPTQVEIGLAPGEELSQAPVSVVAAETVRRR